MWDWLGLGLVRAWWSVAEQEEEKLSRVVISSLVLVLA